MENKEENFSPIVKLKKLNLEDLLLKGVKIIRDESAILQEEMARMRTRPKIIKRYFVDENSEFDGSDSSDENLDYTYEDYSPEKIKPKDKNSKRKKRDSVEENSESDNSDPHKESPNSDKASDSEEEKPKLKNKVSKHKSKKLTEYEKLVQKNKEEKLAFLDSLKIDEIKESFADAVKGLKPKRKKLEKKTILVEPRINQKRSAKVEIDFSEKAMIKKAMTLPDSETSRKKLPQVLTFKDALAEEDSYEDFTKDFSYSGKYSFKPFKKYVSHFQTMQKFVNKVILSNGCMISSVSFHPMREKIILASSCSKEGKIGLWNVDSNSDPYELEAHSEGISHLKFNPDNPNMLVSSSYDGTLRCGDLEKRVFNEIYKTSYESACNYFDCVSAKTFLVAQKKKVVVVDVRKKRIIYYYNDAIINSIDVHPLDKKYFISAGIDGFVRLWDMRQLKKIPILEFQHSSKYVKSAYFSPLTGKHILTSGGSIVGLYYCADLIQVVPKNTLPKLGSNSSYSIRAVWLPNRDDIFIAGGRYQAERIEIYNVRMKNIFTYENLRCAPLPHMFHPSLPVLAAANCNGKISILADRST